MASTWNYESLGLHRSRDPGAGAFSPYGNRTATVSRDVKAGEELYVHYGEHWFEGREFLGAVPLTKDLDRATELYQTFVKHKNQTREQPKNADALPAVSSQQHNATAREDLWDEVWERFVQNTTWK